MGILILIALFLAVSAAWSQMVANGTDDRFISKLNIFVYVYVISLFICSILTISPFYGTTADIIYFVLFISIILSGVLIFSEFIYAAVKRKKSEALKILGIGVIMLACSLATSFLLVFLDGSADHFGKRHPIPIEMAYEEPADPSKYGHYAADSMTANNFIIFEDFQPGMYSYNFNLKEGREGTVYLKCFEATEGMALSESSIKNATTIHVSQKDSLHIYKQEGYFKVHEGSWGEPYAARFELWFQPADSDTPKMLASKIYKIEGWSR